MEINRVEAFDPIYPLGLLQALGARAPETIYLMGEPELVTRRTLGLLSSVKCPGDVIQKTYDLVKALRHAGIPVIGGFHSPMEKQCLSMLLKGTQPVVICLGRSIEGMKISRAWRAPLAKGRLLLVSCFGSKRRRLTEESAGLRNRYVAVLADQVLVAHAARGSRTERCCEYILGLGKLLWTPDCEQNRRLMSMGARPLSLDTLSSLKRLALGDASGGSSGKGHAEGLPPLSYPASEDGPFGIPAGRS